MRYHISHSCVSNGGCKYIINIVWFNYSQYADFQKLVQGEGQWQKGDGFISSA